MAKGHRDFESTLRKIYQTLLQGTTLNSKFEIDQQIWFSSKPGALRDDKLDTINSKEVSPESWFFLWKMMYEYVRTAAKNVQYIGVSLSSRRPFGRRENITRKFNHKRATFSFKPVTTGRERSAALRVNLLACRMRNRRQTAASGAFYPDIFLSYLYFIAGVTSYVAIYYFLPPTLYVGLKSSIITDNCYSK